jgi:hypothetical protein
MARSAVGEVLQPLAVADEPWPPPLAPPRSRARRRWPVAIVAAAIVAVGLAVPIRLEVARSELVRLQERFAGYTSDETATQSALEQLREATYPGDEELMRDAAARVSKEEADLLAQVDRGLAGSVVVDGKLAVLRKEMRRFLRLRIADLRIDRFRRIGGRR